jgi:hypothetical protein
MMQRATAGRNSVDFISRLFEQGNFSCVMGLSAKGGKTPRPTVCNRVAPPCDP